MRRSVATLAAWMALGACAGGAAASGGGASPTPADDGACADARAFDFWLGSWEVDQEIRTAQGDWERYPARSTVTRALGGCALVERWEGTVRFFWEGMEAPETMRGLSVRARDPESGLWRIHWMDSRAPVFGAPWEGRFDRGEGTFLHPPGDAGAAVDAGGTPLPGATRIRFFDVAPDAVEWELAVRGAEGWTPLWKMHFRRAP